MKKLLLALLMLAPFAANAQNVSTVTIANGIPTAGTGTVSTLDNLIGTAGTAKSNVLSVQGITSMVPLKMDGSGFTQPVSAASLPLPTGASTSANQSSGNTSLAAIATSSATIATNSGAPVPACGATPCTNAIGNVYQVSPYPAGAVPITASATGTTAATTATLAATTGKTTYICSLAIRANATAAATGNATVTGTITGTLNFTQWTAPTASGIGTVEERFSPCVPASAVNTAIAVISAAPGTAGVVSVTATGFQL